MKNKTETVIKIAGGLGKLKNSDLELIVEAINEGYTKKELAKKYDINMSTINKFIKGLIEGWTIVA